MSPTADALGAFRINAGELHPGTLTVTRDLHRLATLGPRPDKGWSYRDKAGHFHAYSTGDDRYPTLYEIPITCSSEHLDGDAWWCECRTEWQCRICREVITPGMVAGPHEEMHPGLTHWEVRLECREGCSPPEVGAMVTVEATSGMGMRFGVAVVSSVGVTGLVAGWTVTQVLLTGAGALGERGKR